MSCRHPLERAFTGQQGSVLLGGLLLVLAMTVIGIALYQASVIESQQISKTETDMRAFYAADAGIHRAALDLADPPSAGILVGGLKFSCNPPEPSNPNCVKDSLPGDNTTRVTLPGYGSRCFGGSTCDSSVTPYKPAYIVEARNHVTADNDRFWLIATACTPGPAKNPCDPGHKMAQIQTEIVKNVITGPPGPPGPGGPGTPNFVFNWGAFGGGSLKMGGNGAMADSYNSHKAGCTVPCPYGGSNIGNNGDIGSNGSIDLTSTILIRGDILSTTNVPGDTSDISLGTSVTVQGNVQTGGTAVIGGVTDPNGQSGGNGSGTTSQVTGTVKHDTASSQVGMDAVANCGGPFTDLTGLISQYPKNPDGTCKWEGTKITATWKYGGTTGCGTCGVSGGKAGELVAGGGVCIDIAPGNYRLGDVTFSGGTWIRVTDRTILTVDGVFTLSGGGIANTTQLPQDLQIISTYGNDIDPVTGLHTNGETKTGVTMSGGSDTYATVYAPRTKAVVSGGGSLFGGVMAKDVEFSGGSGVHFDEYLASGEAGLEKGTPGLPGTPPTTLATIYTLLGWKKVECGPSTFAC